MDTRNWRSLKMQISDFFNVYFLAYRLKFGMCHVDFKSPNRTRTEKASAGFYSRVISSRVVPS